MFPAVENHAASTAAATGCDDTAQPKEQPQSVEHCSGGKAERLKGMESDAGGGGGRGVALQCRGS